MHRHRRRRRHRHRHRHRHSTTRTRTTRAPGRRACGRHRGDLVRGHRAGRRQPARGQRRGQRAHRRRGQGAPFAPFAPLCTPVHPCAPASAPLCTDVPPARSEPTAPFAPCRTLLHSLTNLLTCRRPASGASSTWGSPASSPTGRSSSSSATMSRARPRPRPPSLRTSVRLHPWHMHSTYTRTAHAVHTQCTRSAHVLHMHCTCTAHARPYPYGRHVSCYHPYQALRRSSSSRASSAVLLRVRPAPAMIHHDLP